MGCTENDQDFGGRVSCFLLLVTYKRTGFGCKSFASGLLVVTGLLRCLCVVRKCLVGTYIGGLER